MCNVGLLVVANLQRLTTQFQSAQRMLSVYFGPKSTLINLVSSSSRQLETSKRKKKT